MDKVCTNTVEIKNIVGRWFKHTENVFVVIIFSLLMFSLGIVIQNEGNKAEIINSPGYENVWTLTKYIFNAGCRLIAFPLVAILLYLICYTVYIISCIMRRIFSSGFNDTIFAFLCLLILSNSIFSYLIGQIGNWCLQANVPNGSLKGLSLSLTWNFLLQSGVIISLLFIKGCARFSKKEEIKEKIFNNISALRVTAKEFFNKKTTAWIMILLVSFIGFILFNEKCVWIDGPLNPPSNLSKSHSMPSFSEYAGYLLPVLVFIFMRYIIRPVKNEGKGKNDC